MAWGMEVHPMNVSARLGQITLVAVVLGIHLLTRPEPAHSAPAVSEAACDHQP